MFLAALALAIPGSVLAAAGCGESSPAGDSAAATAASTTESPGRERATEIAAAVERWSVSRTLPEAKAEAERARNLITGPHVEGAGDGDRDGNVDAVAVGLLPGEDGSPGLVKAGEGRCVDQDVLGGSWDDPAARWADVLRRVDAYSATNNEFPGLPSHAQRTVGWASLTLEASTLDEAIEYAGHATGHAQVVVDALANPDAATCPGG